jgi:hypothetical protein
MIDSACGQICKHDPDGTLIQVSWQFVMAALACARTGNGVTNHFSMTC